jgi:hypothetical protein
MNQIGVAGSTKRESYKSELRARTCADGCAHVTLSGLLGPRRGHPFQIIHPARMYLAFKSMAYFYSRCPHYHESGHWAVEYQLWPDSEHPKLDC